MQRDMVSWLSTTITGWLKSSGAAALTRRALIKGPPRGKNVAGVVSSQVCCAEEIDDRDPALCAKRSVRPRRNERNRGLSIEERRQHDPAWASLRAACASNGGRRAELPLISSSGSLPVNRIGGGGSSPVGSTHGTAAAS